MTHRHFTHTQTRHAHDSTRKAANVLHRREQEKLQDAAANAYKCRDATERGWQQSLFLHGHAYLCNCQQCQSDTTIAMSGLRHRRTMLHLRVMNVTSGNHNDGSVQLV